MPRSLLLGSGRDKAPFLDSFYHGPLLYSVNYEKKTLFFPPIVWVLFVRFSLQWGIPWSHICHGKRSDPWVCFIHSWFTCTCTTQPFSPTPPSKISRVYNKYKTPKYSWSHQSEFQDLPDCAQLKPESSPLWVCALRWALYYPKYQYLPQSKLFS